MSLTAVVTGHSRGVGQAILNLLEKNGVEVHGISRVNGFDLSENYEKVRDFITKNDFDVFINNAYVENNQTKLLKDVYDEWKEKEKLIINICSAAALLPEAHPDYNMKYPCDKRSQREFCHSVNFEYSKKDFSHIKCGLINLNFDYVSTSFKSKYDKRMFPNLSPEEVADIIWYAINAFQNNICFRDVSFHSTRKPEINRK